MIRLKWYKTKKSSKSCNIKAGGEFCGVFCLKNGLKYDWLPDSFSYSGYFRFIIQTASQRIMYNLLHLTLAGFFLLSEGSVSVSRHSWRSAGDPPCLLGLHSAPWSTSDLDTSHITHYSVFLHINQQHKTAKRVLTQVYMHKYAGYPQVMQKSQSRPSAIIQNYNIYIYIFNVFSSRCKLTLSALIPCHVRATCIYLKWAQQPFN